MKKILFSLLVLIIGSAANGQSWIQIPPSQTSNYTSCWFSTSHPDTGYLGSYFIVGGHLYPLAFKTTDGGVTVNNQGLSLAQSFLNPGKMDFTSDDVGYFVGWGVIKTSDGGVNWNVTLDMGVAGGVLYDVTFISPTDGYAVGESFLGASGGYEGMLQKTTDAGVNWTSYSVSQLNNNDASQLLALSRSTSTAMIAGGMASGSGGFTLFRSVDDGVTWNQLNFYNSVYSLAAAAADTFYMAADLGIYRITNQGATITLVQSVSGSTINSIKIKNYIGFAVTSDGSIYQSLNNGLTWAPMISPVQGVHALNQVYIVSPQLAWAVGASGTILKYTSSSTFMSEINPAVRMHISPNPATDYISIQGTGFTSHLFEISFYNVSGSLAKKLENVDLKDPLFIGDLQKGVYILKVKSATVEVYLKLVMVI